MEILIISALALVALAVVAYPALRRGSERPTFADATIDAEVRRYRAALRSGTVCPKCLEANPAGSQYCADCGRALADEGGQADGPVS